MVCDGFIDESNIAPMSGPSGMSRHEPTHHSVVYLSVISSVVVTLENLGQHDVFGF